MAAITWLGTDASNPGDFDSTANWSSSSVPGAGDTVIFTSEYNYDCTVGMNQGTTAFSSIVVEAGFTASIGSFTSPLTSDPSKFEYHGGGIIWIKLGSTGIPVVVSNSGASANGSYGVNLEGTVSTLTVSNGRVGYCTHTGQTGSVTNVRVSGGVSVLGSNLTSVTNVDITGGEVETRETPATVKVYNGKFKTAEDAGVSTKLTLYGGSAVLAGTGTVADLLLDAPAGSTVDMTTSGIARTITAFKNNGGSLLYDPNVITITTETDADKAIRKTVANLNG